MFLDVIFTEAKLNRQQLQREVRFGLKCLRICEAFHYIYVSVKNQLNNQFYSNYYALGLSL